MLNRRNFIWNSIAGIINASEAVILSMVITRTNGLYDAGILTIAFAVGNLMMAIGKYGMRNYQVTDVSDTYKFADYLMSRFVTVGVMLFVSLIYVLIQSKVTGYAISKAIIVFCLCGIYASESLEDVFAGLYQRKGRLDLGGKIFTARWIVILVTFILILIFKQNLLLAATSGMIMSYVSMILLIKLTFPYFNANTDGASRQKVFSLLRQCFPLCVVAFFGFYITSAPKYAIDRYLSEEDQACYGFISMPVFVIQLLNSFIYQPILVSLADYWNKGELRKLEQAIKKQSLFLLGITIFVEVAGYIAGIPVLSLIYGTNLAAYKVDFLILLLGGAFLALSSFLGVILTIMRRQNIMLIVYFSISMLSLALFGTVVQNNGIRGAVILYLSVMILLSVLYFMFVQNNLKRGDSKNV